MRRITSAVFWISRIASAVVFWISVVVFCLDFAANLGYEWVHKAPPWSFEQERLVMLPIGLIVFIGLLSRFKKKERPQKPLLFIILSFRPKGNSARSGNI